MSLVFKYVGLGLDPDTIEGTVNPGIGGRGDLGWPINGGAFPKPDPGGEGPGFGHAFSFLGIGAGRKQDNTQPDINFSQPYFPLATKGCWTAFRATSQPWVQPPARTRYSITFMWSHMIGDTGFDQPYEFFRVMDETSAGGPLPPTTVRRWGLQYQGQILFDLGGAEPRKLLITNQSGGGLAGYTSWQAPLNVPVKYQIQVDSALNPSVTVRAYTESVNGNENWVLRATLTANPASVAMRQIAWGAPFEEQSATRFQTSAGNLIGAKLVQPMVWDTYNADGNFVGTAAYVTYDYPQVTAVLKGATSAESTPLTIAGLKNGDGTFTNLGRALNYPRRGGLRASRKIKPPEMGGDGGYQVYGSDADAEATNQTLQMYYPTTPMPAGGYPCVIWGNTQYFISGDWSSLTSTNYEMLHNLIHRGYAVCSFGVTNGNLASPINLFPKIVVQAKECIKWVKTNRAVSVGGKINPNKIFLSGHSAGGWIAGMAGITRNLVSANGTDFTLAGNGKTGPDPSVVGIVMFNSPIDLTTTRLYDPTHPGFSPANLYYTGSIHAVTATLLGAAPAADPDISKIDVPQYIIENHANIPPIRYQSGTNDSVIPPFNGTALQAACASVGHPFSIRWTTGSIHTEGAQNFNPSFLDWMDDILEGL